MSERTVRCGLEEHGIARRSRGRGNREDRVILDLDRVARLYLGEGLSADQVGAVFGCSRSVVLRCLRDAGLPVRTSPAGGGGRRILDALYADPAVRATLGRHGVPVVACPGPLWARFPKPVALTETLVRDLYEGCGVGLTHIELLTGQPAATVGHHCVAWGIMLRRPGGRCPFLRRLELAGSPTDAEDA
jgi:hypothetical protein